MAMVPADLVTRIRKLGLECDEIPTEAIVSATAALACVPMYMVSNVHGWTGEKQFKVPFLRFDGSEAFREAFAIGGEEVEAGVEPKHRKILGQLLKADRAADLIIYEHAIESLRQLLGVVTPAVADELRFRVARATIAVAKAAGKGIMGSGEKVSAEERATIEGIAAALSLAESDRAKALLDSF
jgi:hypothetical protein